MERRREPAAALREPAAALRKPAVREPAARGPRVSAGALRVPRVSAAALGVPRDHIRLPDAQPAPAGHQGAQGHQLQVSN